MRDRYQIKSDSFAHPDALVQGDQYRFTVLTPQLIRMEYQAQGNFEDRPTQIVLNRNFAVPEFKLIETEKEIEIITDHIHLIYQKGPFTENNLKVEVTGNISTYHSVWHYGEKTKDLSGTARTLDRADGAVPLESGLLSKLGYSLIDDSRSVILKEDGFVEPRDTETIDLYFLGYGREYLNCLKDFYYLSGFPPLLPRYTLGNWWSRYHRYSESSYKKLMERFERENIPFSVAVIDMDWHLVDIDPKYGSGWTGYTWNRELFPDPSEFMNWLHDKGLAVSLNVHPANGVMPHEEMYAEMARTLGVNAQNDEAIHFDFTNPKFIEAYFAYLHHPNEDMGVDFWWIDWQSGSISKIAGLDPMWMLNHYHFLDSKRRGKRALTFSRYVGIGSHRYPVGFSGDTYITWDSLDFQPYFTANASNVGYGWWSHDIGGHYKGYYDDELAVRWAQFGVFSPINRAHSHENPFIRKEPWHYDEYAGKIIKSFWRLRHKLIPYLYTMNVRHHTKGMPLVQPMYYHDPWEEAAYEVKNQYYFGSELIVHPITSKMDSSIKMGHVTAWLPEGTWFDFFNGRKYEGDRKIKLYRGINELPVLAKAGGIVPMTEQLNNQTGSPESLLIRIFAGANGEFTLFEDDGNSCEEDQKGFAETHLSFEWDSLNQRATFKINRPREHTEVLPKKRSYRLEFTGMQKGSEVDVFLNGELGNSAVSEIDQSLVIEIPAVEKLTEVYITVKKAFLKENDVKTELFDFLKQIKLSYTTKELIYSLVDSEKNQRKVLTELQSLNLPEPVIEAISEILWAS